MKRLLLVALLAGCATTRVETTTTTFYADGYEPRGTIAVRALEGEVARTLEFQAYKPRIEKRLAAAGYRIDDEAPAYVALVSYGIDAGRTGSVTVPIYGQTQGGTSYSFGTLQGPAGPQPYSGTTYSAPSYGIVGTATRPVTWYTRTVAIDIVEAASLGHGAPRKVFEMRARSAGQCGTLAEVLEPMLEAMFEGFPGVNGRARTVRVPIDVDC